MHQQSDQNDLKKVLLQRHDGTTKETHIKIITFNCVQRAWRIYEEKKD